MTQSSPHQEHPILNFNAYSPAEIENAIEKVGVKKVNLPFLPCFMLGVVAGAGIGLGALFYSIVASDASLSFAVTRVLGGLVFCLGLVIVLVGGAELFTGNNLVVMAWASGQVTTQQVLRNWVTVWLANFVGAVGLALLIHFSHVLDLNNGRVGSTFLTTAIAKISPDWFTLLIKGILCNLLVCLAVWLASAGRSVADKILALVLPISAFVAAGFEHSVANMFFLSLAWLETLAGKVPAGLDTSVITIPGILHNLFWVTLGNIIGGAGFVGLTYWIIYHYGLSAAQTAQDNKSAL